ncbi:MAG: transposase, partial [Nitrososphaeraceae archaeon]
ENSDCRCSVYSKENFTYLYDSNIEAAINQINQKSYGQRWIVESVFSSMKRMFGEEFVSARRFPNMVKEMMLLASLYDMFNTMK